MEPRREELLSALKDAEEFISVTLLREPLSAEAQMKRQQLERRLKSLTKQGQPEFEQEIYDDVIESDTQPDDGPRLHLEGVPQDSTEDEAGQDIYDDTVPEDNTQEIYDDTVPEDTQAQEIYDDTVPETDEIVEDYEVAEPSQPIPSDGIEADETYDDMEIKTDDSKSMDSIDSRERSTTQELESLVLPIKPEDVEGIIKTDFLDKHRKKGIIYLGSKWQRRFCVLRSFVLYYYSGPNAPAQKGSIILPGYTVSPHNSSKNNKEFILKKAKDRSYMFMAKSKEEADKWIEAIREAANTNKISQRQSEILDRLCSTGDEDTISYSDASNGIASSETTALEEEQEELYEDVGQTDSWNEKPPLSSSAVSTPPQPPRPSKPPAQPPSEEQETYDDVGITAAEIPPVDEEMYDDVGVSAPPQPERPKKPAAPIPPTDEEQETYDDVGVSPPPQPERPNKAAAEIPPETDEDEEMYDDVGVVSPHPQPQRPKRPVSEIPPTTEEEEDDIYDDVGVSGPEVPPVDSKPPIQNRTLPHAPTNESKPSPPLAPRIPLPPTPNEAPKPIIPPRIPTPPQEDKTLNKAPPPPLPESETINKAPPPPPPEEEAEQEEIDNTCVYQALWDCRPDAEDELEFSRGDLLYIYERPHSDWWIGSKLKPQGYETRLIPTNYLTQAYDM